MTKSNFQGSDIVVGNIGLFCDFSTTFTYKIFNDDVKKKLKLLERCRAWVEFKKNPRYANL